MSEIRVLTDKEIGYMVDAINNSYESAILQYEVDRLDRMLVKYSSRTEFTNDELGGDVQWLFKLND